MTLNSDLWNDQGALYQKYAFNSIFIASYIIRCGYHSLSLSDWFLFNKLIDRFIIHKLNLCR